MGSIEGGIRMKKRSRIDTHLVFPVEQIPTEMLENLTLENPTYYKNLKMGISTKGIPERINLYEEKDGYYYLPRALNVGLTVEDDFRVEGQAVELNFTGELRDYQQPAVDKLANVENGILQAGTGRGKGHPLDTILYTPNGKTTMGELQVGDELIGSNGKPIKVTAIYDRGTIPTYRVTLNDGTSLLCDGEHLFTVQKAKHRTRGVDKWETRQVQELMNDLTYADGRAKWYLPLVKPVEFKEQDVLIDPYLLGCLIADGTLREEGTITFSNSESDIIAKIGRYCTLHQASAYDFNVINGFELKSYLKELGLLGKKSHEKFIPDIYKYNTIEVRLKLLQGLFDCDGGVEEESRLIYYTSSEQLAKDVQEVVQSLGGVARISCKEEPKYTHKGEKRTGRPSYRVSIILDEFEIFTSNKHKEKFKGRTKYFACRSIKSIEYVGEKEIRCISVSAEDKLYCAEHFIVTHNTVMALAAIARVGVTTLVLVHKEFLMNQWVERIRDFLGYEAGIIRGDTWDWKGKKIVVGMLQTFHSRKDKIPQELLDYFGLIVTDETHRVAAHTWQNVVTMFPAKRRWGLTATVKRTDNLQDVFLSHIGPVIYKIDGVMTTPNIVQFKMKYEFDLKPFRNRYGNKDVNISKLVTAVCKIPQRNDTIIDIVSMLVEKGRKTIVFSERVAHLEELNKMFNDKMNSKGYLGGLYIGGMSQKERDTVAKECDVLFATYHIAKEGLDIPELDTCIFASPVSNDITVTQSVGRITRLHEGKKEPLVIDIVDTGIPIFMNMWYKRLKTYGRLNYPVHTW